MSGSLVITRTHDGRWALSVNGGRPRVFDTFDAALLQAASVSFAPGESPGSWRVVIDER